MVLLGWWRICISRRVFSSFSSLLLCDDSLHCLRWFLTKERQTCDVYPWMKWQLRRTNAAASWSTSIWSTGFVSGFFMMGRPSEARNWKSKDAHLFLICLFKNCNEPHRKIHLLNRVSITTMLQQRWAVTREKRKCVCILVRVYVGQSLLSVDRSIPYRCRAWNWWNPAEWCRTLKTWPLSWNQHPLDSTIKPIDGIPPRSPQRRCSTLWPSLWGTIHVMISPRISTWK